MATLIDERIAKGLGVKGSRVELRLSGVGGECALYNSEKIDIEISGELGAARIVGAITTRDIGFPSYELSPELVDEIYRFTCVKLKPCFKEQASILIGQNNWEVIETLETIVIGNGLGLSRTRLGWTIHGNLNKDKQIGDKTYLIQEDQVLDRENDEAVDSLIKNFFELENIGVSDDAMKTKDYTRAEEILNASSRKTSSGWETGLLWKQDCPADTDGYCTARKRLRSLEKRIDRDPEYARLYYAEMKRFIQAGYASRVEKTSVDSRVWYLPHFGVTNANKPGKIRLVFDAAAKTSNISLNDQLEAGPDLLQALPGVITRFRKYKIAFKADISDMFLRIGIVEQDHDAQCFLWRGRDRRNDPEVYVMNSLIFGANCSPCCAIYIKNRNASEFALEAPSAANSIVLNSYMDDYLMSVDSEDEAAAMIKEVIKINERANFAMHGWASNAKSMLDSALQQGQIRETTEMSLGEKQGEKVLGLVWETGCDELRFNVKFVKIQQELVRSDRRPTKREVLKIIMSVFDPLGLVAPFSIRSKIIMREIWRSGVGWDTPIREDEFVGWKTWLASLNDIKECQVPRCLIEEIDSDVQLHTFCDASSQAFAAVSYLRVKAENEPVKVKILISKSRSASLKPMSIPRLELQAALLGARLAKYVEKKLQLTLSRKVFWSDSTVTLAWLRGDPAKKQVFVANRIGEVQQLTRVADWRWVPTAENPADDATRVNKNAILKDSRWFHGPKFLREEDEKWPVEKPLCAKSKFDADKLEARDTRVFMAVAKVTNSPLFIRLIGWKGLMLVAKWVIGVIDRLRRMTPHRRPPVEERELCENYLYRVIQTESFGKDVKMLAAKGEIAAGSALAKLNPFLDAKKIVRADGRATRLHKYEGFDNQPVILDAKHPATKMLIKQYHQRFLHGSDESLRNELKEKYFIFGLRAALRSTSNSCLHCRIQRGKPREPMMADLPAARLAVRQRPFSHCGVDYFSPYFIKIGRRREKRWGVIFTCLTTRAIHLELASSLSASSAIMALQRLASHRGTPSVMYSDNGTNFKGASKEFKHAFADLDIDRVKGHAENKGIEWRFNPPDAPHMGGAWERLIRSVKVGLNAVLREQAPTEEVLYTLLTEVDTR